MMWTAQRQGREALLNNDWLRSGGFVARP
mgnify:CR=1